MLEVWSKFARSLALNRKESVDMAVLNFASFAKAIKEGMANPTQIGITQLLLDFIVCDKNILNSKGEPYNISSYYTNRWWNQHEDIPGPIKEAAASTEIMSKATAYFKNEVISALSSQKESDAYLALYHLVKDDPSIADDYKKKLLDYRDNDDLTAFVSKTFLYAIQKDNRKIDNNRDKAKTTDDINDNRVADATKKEICFYFSISFSESEIELDVTSENGVAKSFHTDYTDCTPDEVPIETKNQLMRWFASDQNDMFKVVLKDSRITYVKSLCEYIETKIDNGEELTLEEEMRYNNLHLLIKRFDHERRVKEKAITVYLKDKLFHSYCHVGFYTQLLDFIKDILEFPYRRGLFQDSEYSKTFKPFDVYTTNIQKEYAGNFVIDLLNSEVEEAFKKDPLLQFNGSFVCDWGSEMAKTIAVQYYVQYIGRQIVDRGRSLLESDEYINTLGTTIINWTIGPH